MQYITAAPRIPISIFFSFPLKLYAIPQKIANGKKPITNPPPGSVMWWNPPQKPEKIGIPKTPKSIYPKTEKADFLTPKV